MSTTIEKITPTGDTLTIREGKAPDILPPQHVAFSGTINTPADYAEHLKLHEMPDESDSRVVVDEYKGTIELFHRHSQDALTEEHVSGKLIENPDLAEFKIFLGTGSPSLRKPELLGEFLRPRRFFFESSDEWASAVARLKNYEAKREQKVAIDTTKTAKNGSFATSHTQENELPEISFVLAIPLFRGQPKSTFRVEICGSVTDGGVNVWLESLELRELLETARQQALETQCHRLRALGLLIVTL
jgi:hypothetical protein